MAFVPRRMIFSRVVTWCAPVVLALLGVAAPGWSLDLSESGSAEQLCEHALPVARAFDLPWLQAPDCDRDAPQSEHEAGEGVGGCHDEGRLIEAMRARRYVSERAALLTEPHEATIAATDFSFAEFDPVAEVVRVQLSAGLPVNGTMLRLEFADDTPIEFAAGPDEAARWEELRVVDGLELRVVFALDLPEGARTEVCRQDAEADALVVGVVPVRAELVDVLTDAVLGSTRTTFERAAAIRWDADVDGDTPGLHPEAALTSLDVVGGDAIEDLDLEMLRYAAETVLLECYVRGLESNAQLRGALVLEFDVGGLESVVAPEVAIDALGSREVAACAVDAVSGMPWALVLGRAPQDGTRVRATLVLHR